MNGAGESSGGARIAVAMSGGVDSSTVAALLQRAGHAVIGLTMQLWDHRRLAAATDAAPTPNRCCSSGDAADARRVAERLGMPHYVVNFEEEFEREVVRPFVEEYRAGRTPIPCSRCNSSIKFDRLLATARAIGADRIATGHYARIVRNADSGCYELHRGMDRAKDQSYFLWGMTQEQLAGALFPLGDLRKPEVRRLAADFELPTAEKPESYEICFVSASGHAAFVDAYADERRLPALEAEGELVSVAGETLGAHAGVHHFTVGQRKGLGLGTRVGKPPAGPLYVLRVEADSRRVTVGEEADLYGCELTASGANWIAGPAPSAPVRVEARIRHRHEPAPAWAEPLADGGLRVRFDQPQRAITPGQAVVMYCGEIVLGGGWIEP